jgi:hypothetical protein
MPGKLNETGMFASERVHVREIVVIPDTDQLTGNRRRAA